MEGAHWKTEAEGLRALAPRHLLFLCVANSARSQMAEGIARSLAPAGVKVSSAGSAPARLDPMAVRVLAEIGLDISDQFAKNLDEAPIGEVDTVITLCANEVCPPSLGQVPLLNWSLPDPADPRASESTQLRAFREVRDELRRRLAVAFGKVS